MIGKVVSHYKIIEKLGEGGMGVVYKAEDTTLRRTVALKFLPQRIKEDPAERERFLREAQAASALNHNNVCTVYDIAEQDSRQFIVMEFVDGVALRQKITSGPLSREDLLSYATQIAEALREAHAKGIVHRDVKPENIMVTRENRIKVMDFGLAKLKGALKLTKTSSTVGTVAYMSPEQIQGGEVDSRSDIFSFGVVLFEMFYGKLPFRGEHEAAMIYSIMHEAPQPMEPQTAGLSGISSIVMRMLEKAPENRYQGMEEVLAAVKTYLQKGESGAQRRRDVSWKTFSRPGRIWLFGALFLLILSAAFFVHRYFIAHGDTQKFFSVRTVGLRGSSAEPLISPDGRYIAFVSKRNEAENVFVMGISEGRPKQMTENMPDVTLLGWSPEGSRIIFAKDSALCEVSLLGGSPQKIGNYSPHIWPSPDGSCTASISREFEGRVVVKDRGNQTEKVVFDISKDLKLKMEYPFSPGYVAWSPGGDKIAILASKALLFTSSNVIRSPFWIASVSLKSNEVKVLIDPAMSGKLSVVDFGEELFWGTDDFIYFSVDRSNTRTIWRIRSDGGDPAQVTTGVEETYNPNLSREGNIFAYTSRQKSSNLWFWETRSGNVSQLTFEKFATDPAYSPVSQRLAYVSYVSTQRQSELVSVDPKTGSGDVLFKNQGYLHNPSWSNDEKYLVCGLENPDTSLAGHKSNAFELMVIERDGNSVSLPIGGQSQAWGRSGKLYFVENTQASVIGTDLHGRMFLYGSLADIDGQSFENNLRKPSELGKYVKRLCPPELKEQDFDLQPQERLAVISGLYDNNNGLGMLDLQTGRNRQLVQQGMYARFTSDGNRITYARKDAQTGLWDLWEVGLDGREEHRLLAVGSRDAFRHCWKPDGSGIAFNKVEEQTDIALIENFKAYLKSKGQ